MTEPDYEEMDGVELALRLNTVEAAMYWTQHDAADGRIDRDVTDELEDLEETRQTIADHLRDRTGHESHDALSEYINETVDLYQETVELYEQGDLEDPTADEQHMIDIYEDLETL
jgi:hypothetical protein